MARVRGSTICRGGSQATATCNGNECHPESVEAHSKQFQAVPHLDEAAAAGLECLIQRWRTTHNTEPLSDHARLHLRRALAADPGGLVARAARHATVTLDPCAGGTGSQHVSAEHIVGYVQVYPTDEGSWCAESVIDPGLNALDTEAAGHAMWQAASAAENHAAPGATQLWSRFDADPVAAQAAANGFTVERTLVRMSASVDASLTTFDTWTSAVTDTDAGQSVAVAIEPAELPTDLADLIRCNRRAFAELPDQGSWTERDFLERFEADWFDSAGLLVARRTGSGHIGGVASPALLGFHWVKLHNRHNLHGHRHGNGNGNNACHAVNASPSHGEVYVLAVDPEAHGYGIGSQLLKAGLEYLRNRGVEQVELYVDSANESAFRLYTHKGFAVDGVERLWSRLDPAPRR